MRLQVVALACLLLAGSVISPSSLSAKSADPPRAIAVTRGAQDPAVSPDGKQIAFSVFGDIFIVPMAGGEARQVTCGLGWDTQPAWSPDGRFLAYAHHMPNGTDLVLRNLETGTESIVHHTEYALGQIAFHPRGGEIFFLIERNQYDSHLWRVGVNGKDPRQLTFAENWHEWSFALDPEGRRVLLDSGRYGGSDLYLLDLETSRSQRLTNTPAHEYSVVWSADGRTHAFIESDNGVDTVVVRPAEGGAARRVHSSSYDQKRLALAPDGRTAVLCAGRQLYRLDLQTGERAPIPFTARFEVPNAGRADLLIINARLFDGVSGTARPNVSVEVRDGRIAAIHEGQPPSRPAGVPVIDAAGRFLMSGLMDNHYHYWSPFDGATLLKRGITAIRDPGVAISESMNFKEAIANGVLAGPDIYTCGPLIDGRGGYHPRVDVSLTDPRAAAALVRALKAQGVDGLKVYFLLNPDVLAAVVREARAIGLPVTGHIGVRTGWREALEAGITGFSHIRVWRDFLPLERQPQGENESLDSRKNPVARMQIDWREIDPDSARVGALLDSMAEKRIGFDPTLFIHRPFEGQRRRLGLDEYAAAEDAYRRMSRFVALAVRKGVPLLAGTDNVALFDELEAYAEAGVPNVEILKAATINGARWLGREREFGTVERGKRADLILVDGDPLSDISHLRNIELVVKGGRVVFDQGL